MVRFFAGSVLGAIMPNVVALVGEYSPRRLRVTIMMAVVTDHGGGRFRRFIAAWLIPHLGRRSVFFRRSCPSGDRGDYIISRFPNLCSSWCCIARGWGRLSDG